jgi:hypothetical protein
MNGMPRVLDSLLLGAAIMAVTAGARVQAPTVDADAPDTSGARVERVFEELETRSLAGDGAGRTYVLAESDLNAFLKAKLKERGRRDVESLVVKMSQTTFVTSLTIDFDYDEMRSDSVGAKIFKALLSGKQTIEVEGRLTTEKGKGTYTVERANMNGIPLPPPLVNSILSALGRRQDPPFDPTEPFDLPYGIQTIEVQEQKTILQT